MKTEGMKILVVGGGGREHTLVWKIAQSPKVERIYAAPGNAGIAELAECIAIKATEVQNLAGFAEEKSINLTVVGPEAPLVTFPGIVDEFSARGLKIFGPTKAAAQIEASKVFAKKLMQDYNIPCPIGVEFSSYDEAKSFIEKLPAPPVIKADGLAAGKGVTVAQTKSEALEALHKVMVEKIHGEAGNRVLIDERLSGEEVSVFAFTDGDTVLPMVPACDYKRAYDGDQGPNTGGMGSYTPSRFYDAVLDEKINKTILIPTVRAMALENKPYQGVLYGGLMITDEGPKVLEFNARFGDPELQVQLPRLKTDLVDILLAVINRTLDQIEIEWSDEACVGVVMASAGYPGSYKTGFPISGLDKLDPDILVFHAGTRKEDGQIVTDGGRILTVVATGKDLSEAREKVYANVPRIHFEGCHYRLDIAKEQ